MPSLENVKECVISEDVVLNKEDPILLFEQTKKQADGFAKPNFCVGLVRRCCGVRTYASQRRTRPP